MTTARDIITLAFKEATVLGVGQTLLAEDANDGLTYLGMMMSQWQARRWMVPALITYNALGTGNVAMTVGPAMDFNIVRPHKIEFAYLIQENTGANPVSIPLSPLFSREAYDSIAIKNLTTLPGYFFYDNAWPTANVYFWPVPSATYRMYITVRKQLVFPKATETGADSLDTDFELPPEYLEAIHYNLAIRLCSGYNRPIQPATAALAKVSLNTIKTTNSQITELAMPSTLSRGRAFSIYNPDGY